MRHCHLGRHSAWEQPRRGLRLRRAVRTRPAGILRAAGHDDAELGRDHLEAFARHCSRTNGTQWLAVLTDPVQAVTTAAAGQLLPDTFLNARQMLAKRAAIGSTRAGN